MNPDDRIVIVRVVRGRVTLNPHGIPKSVILRMFKLIQQGVVSCGNVSLVGAIARITPYQSQSTGKAEKLIRISATLKQWVAVTEDRG